VRRKRNGAIVPDDEEEAIFGELSEGHGCRGAQALTETFCERLEAHQLSTFAVRQGDKARFDANRAILVVDEQNVPFSVVATAPNGRIAEGPNARRPRESKRGVDSREIEQRN
jgi:hypothetical protein